MFWLRFGAFGTLSHESLRLYDFRDWMKCLGTSAHFCIQFWLLYFLILGCFIVTSSGKLISQTNAILRGGSGWSNCFSIETNLPFWLSIEKMLPGMKFEKKNTNFAFSSLTFFFSCFGWSSTEPVYCPVEWVLFLNDKTIALIASQYNKVNEQWKSKACGMWLNVTRIPHKLMCLG